MNEAVQNAWREFCLKPGEDTFASFYNGTKNFIYAICNRIVGNEEEAADILQSVYSQLLDLSADTERALSVPDIDEVVKKLAIRMADTCRKSKARSGQRFESSEALEWAVCDAPSARDLVASEQVQVATRAAIDSLDDVKRQVLLMQYEEGMTQAQVAEQLKLSRPYVTRLTQRATAEVEQHLRLAGITESAVLILVALLMRKPAAAQVPLAAARVYTALMAKAPSAAATVAGAQFTAGAFATKALAVAAAVAVLSVIGVVAQTGRHGLADSTKQLSAAPQASAAGSAKKPTGGNVEFRTRDTGKASKSASSSPPSQLLAEVRPPAGMGALTGKVLNRYTGGPVANVSLKAISQNSSAPAASVLPVLSDTNGEFRFPGLPAGNYVVHAVPPAPFTNEDTSATVAVDLTNSVGPIQLSRLGTIRGRVVRAPDDSPVVGEVIQAQDVHFDIVAQTRTGPDGRFTLTGLPMPSYAVTLPDQQIVKRVQISEEKDPEPLIRISNGSITGTITRGGTPLRQAYVYAVRNEEGGYLDHLAYADADGHYTIKGLAEGPWQIEARTTDAGNPQSVKQTINVDENELTTWDAEVPSGKLAGIAKDSNGRVLAGVTVRAQPTAQEPMNAVPSNFVTTSSKTGEFSFSNLPEGMYTVSAVGDGSVIATARVSVPMRGEVRAELKPDASAPGAVESVALDFASGDPVRDAWCTVVGPDGPIALTQPRESNGRLHIGGLKPAKYLVSVSANGYTVSSHEIEVRAGATVQVTDVLEEAGAFTWTLHDASGIGKPGVTCHITPTDFGALEVERAGETNDDGTWVVRGLRPGTYTAEAVLNGKTTTLRVVINAHAMAENRTQLESPRTTLAMF
jgi:RNA polymerase sigma factor (sigma-70 family)